jgi:hypothetical protein
MGGFILSKYSVKIPDFFFSAAALISRNSHKYTSDATYEAGEDSEEMKGSKYTMARL